MIQGFFSCGAQDLAKGWDIYPYLKDNDDIIKIESLIYQYRKSTHKWPTSQMLDSLNRKSEKLDITINFRKIKDNGLKNFKKIELKDSNDTLYVNFRLEYNDPENGLKSIEGVRKYESLSCTSLFTNVELHPDIKVGTRTILTRKEKRRFRTWKSKPLAERAELLKNNQ